MSIGVEGTKEFCQETHDKHDPRARAKCVEFIKKIEPTYVVKNNPNKYATDLQVFNKEGVHKYSIEVEVKTAWRDDWFPVKFKKLVHVPYRKLKSLSEPKTFYMQFSNDCSRAMCGTGTDIVKFETVLKYCKNNSKDVLERFFEVPHYDPKYHNEKDVLDIKEAWAKVEANRGLLCIDMSK